MSASPDSATWDKNLYAYCDNNPVSRKDDGGQFWHVVVGAAIGGAIGAASAFASEETGLNILIGFAAGAVGGALAASGAGVVIQAAGSATLSMLSNASMQIRKINADTTGKTTFDVGDMLFDGAVGLACGIAGGNGASYGNKAGIKAATKQLFKKGFFDPNARSYYVKNACRAGGDHVFDALLSALDKTAIGSAVTTAKNWIRKAV